MKKTKTEIRERATRETILQEQARLKKEPFMIKAETWSYVVEDKKGLKTTEEKPKPKTKPQHKKSSSKKRK